MPPENPTPSVKETTGTTVGTSVGTKKVKRHRVKDATSSKPKDKQKKKKKKTKENNEPQNSEEDEQRKRPPNYFVVSPTLSAAEWETGKKRPSYLKALPKVDLTRAIFLPYPTKKIWANVSPYPHEELEAARGRLIEGLKCNSPVFSRVKIKCGILPDGRRFAIPPPSFNPQGGAPNPSTSSVTSALFVQKKGRSATHTVTSEQAEEPALEATDPDGMLVEAHGSTGDREHPPSDLNPGPSVTSTVLCTQASASLKRSKSGNSSASDLDGGVLKKRPRDESCGGESSSQELSSSRTQGLTTFMNEDLRASGSSSGMGENILPDSTGRMLLSVSQCQGASGGSLNYASFRTGYEAFQDQCSDTAGPSTQRFSLNFSVGMSTTAVPDCPPRRPGPSWCDPTSSVEKPGSGPGGQAVGKAAPTQGGKKPWTKKQKAKYWNWRRRLEMRAAGNDAKAEDGKAKKKKKKKNKNKNKVTTAE